MGRYVFKLPDVGEGTAEAEIVAWHIAVGDRIEEDQQLVDVMTDKATVEMTSPVTGVVVSLHGQPGEMATVGAPLVELDVEGAGNAEVSPPAATSSHAQPEKRGEKEKSARDVAGAREHNERASAAKISGHEGREEGDRAAKSAHAPAAAFATRAPGTKPLASPAVRQRAEEMGISLPFVPGTG